MKSLLLFVLLTISATCRNADASTGDTYPPVFYWSVRSVPEAYRVRTHVRETRGMGDENERIAMLLQTTTIKIQPQTAFLLDLHRFHSSCPGTTESQGAEFARL